MTMPRVTSPMPADVVTSPTEEHAAIAMMTVQRQATRSEMECSGGPGRFALRIASIALMETRRQAAGLSCEAGPPHEPSGDLPHADRSPSRGSVPRARLLRAGPAYPVPGVAQWCRGRVRRRARLHVGQTGGPQSL